MQTFPTKILWRVFHCEGEQEGKFFNVPMPNYPRACISYRLTNALIHFTMHQIFFLLIKFLCQFKHYIFFKLYFPNFIEVIIEI